MKKVVNNGFHYPTTIKSYERVPDLPVFSQRLPTNGYNKTLKPIVVEADPIRIRYITPK